MLAARLHQRCHPPFHHSLPPFLTQPISALPTRSTFCARARRRPPPRFMPGPRGRRGDQVGGFTLMYKEDLRRVGPHWLKFTEAVRFDSDVSAAVHAAAAAASSLAVLLLSVGGGGRCRRGALPAQRAVSINQGRALHKPDVRAVPAVPALSSRFKDLHRRSTHSPAHLTPLICARRGSCPATRTAPTRATAPGSAKCTATATVAPPRTCGTRCTTRPCSTQATRWQVGAPKEVH